jgi:hypothetical protein
MKTFLFYTHLFYNQKYDCILSKAFYTFCSIFDKIKAIISIIAYNLKSNDSKYYRVFSNV